MKNILVAAAVLLAVFSPALTHAAGYEDNFDDNTLNATLWSKIDSGGSAGSWLSETNSRLEWNPTAASGDNFALYGSEFTFAPTSNFGFRADFHHTPTGDYESSVDFGIVRLDSGDNPTLAAVIMAENTGSSRYFTSEIWDDGGTTHLEDADVRTISDGWLGIEYIAATDTLQFGAFNTSDVNVAGASYPNFAGDFGTDPFHLVLGGFVYDDVGTATLVSGEAYLDNFTQSSVTPEPVTVALFALGGGALGLSRMRRRKKAVRTA